MSTRQIKPGINALSFADYATGIYMLRIVGARQMGTHKVIKN